MKKVYDSKLPLLLTGKTGTGKSYRARDIHCNSIHKNKKFLRINLGSLNENIIESELFGHARGSFSGAMNSRIGLCEAVGDGTLFMDEIGEISLKLQTKLLTLVEDREFIPMGTNVARRFKGRFIFATNKDLKELVNEGEFREDLYYRINNFNEKLESLESFSEYEFFEIVRCLIEKLSNENIVVNISDEYIKKLYTYSWPGNIRQLRAHLEKVYYGWNKFDEDYKANNSAQINKCLGLKAEVELCEKKYILKWLKLNNYRINKTARDIQISKTTLIAKIRKYGISISSLQQL